MDHKIKSDMDAVQRRLDKKAKKLEEEQELKLLRKKIADAEKDRYAEMSKEQLLKKLNKLMNKNLS